jgi:hypothetical protein
MICHAITDLSGIARLIFGKYSKNETKSLHAKEKSGSDGGRV